MALDLCLEIPEIPDPFALTLPGGIEIEDVNLMKIIQPALTPLVPFFDLIDTIVALFNCIKAIPDAFGPPPDPTVFATCLPDLAKKLNKLLNMLPQVALPRLIVRLLTLVIESLRTVRSQLMHLQAQMLQILGTIDRAKQLEDAGLMAIAQCAQANVAQEAANVGKSLAAIGKLLGLINLFMGLIGGPEVPDLSNLAGRPLDDTIPPLDELLKALEAVRELVPGGAQ
ncbi:MAG: hypothetical protein MUF64_33000 [Polyangiaceae bacterium]|jgi:hypothetical protein|nr:hypothetical protein [Polyangiaceae bacterium]